MLSSKRWATAFNPLALPNTGIGFASVGTLWSYGGGSYVTMSFNGAEVVRYENAGPWYVRSTTIISWSIGAASVGIGISATSGILEVNDGGTQGAWRDLKLRSLYVSATNFMLRVASAITSGAAASIGTLTNAPAAGNPTKWMPVDDNGTTRYVPMW